MLQQAFQHAQRFVCVADKKPGLHRCEVRGNGGKAMSNSFGFKLILGFGLVLIATDVCAGRRSVRVDSDTS